MGLNFFNDFQIFIIFISDLKGQKRTGSEESIND
jgi:hypothetical protein